MITRYTREEMGRIWTQENRFQKMLEVEVAVAQVQAKHKMIPTAAAAAIKKKGKFSVKRIEAIEKKTRHDVIAFVTNVAENVGPQGRYVHFGLTSSDVLDTALSLLVADARPVLTSSLKSLLKALKKGSEKYSDVLCSGRTHGMHAEPVSFGLKLAGFYTEFSRHMDRINRAFDQMAIGKLSGAVGTYSALPPEIEKGVCDLLGLKPETLATQVIPRDRHAELFSALALLGGGLERLAVELRHLQRTEVYEVFESFQKGQKGSSAMPHKKNPISAENITGCSRLLRSYCLSSLENIALWHERDISHSSVERVIFPDALILADYACDRMAGVIERLDIDEKRMRANMDLSQGQLFSSHVLLEIVKAGLTREKAYELVQRVSHSLKEGEHLKEALLEDSEVKKYVKPKSINKIFSGESHRKGIEKVVKRALKSGPKGVQI